MLIAGRCRRTPGRAPRRDRVLLDDLEVDGERPLRARLEILEDRGEEVILEPFLVVAVRRAQADSPVVDADALDGTQPEIAVRRLHHRFDGPDRLGPELKHPAPPVHSRLNEKIISDFRRVHATSPCLSTAIGNRQLPSDEGLDHQIFGFLFRLVANAARSGSARGAGSLSNRRKRQQARSGRASRKLAKIGQIIFSRSLRKRCTRSNPQSGMSRVSKRSRVHFRFMAEMQSGPRRISCAFPVFDGGKPHAMGACAYDARKIRNSLDGERAKFSERRALILRRKTARSIPAAVTTLSGRVR